MPAAVCVGTGEHPDVDVEPLVAYEAGAVVEDADAKTKVGKQPGLQAVELGVIGGAVHVEPEVRTSVGVHQPPESFRIGVRARPDVEDLVFGWMQRGHAAR